MDLILEEQHVLTVTHASIGDMVRIGVDEYTITDIVHERASSMGSPYQSRSFGILGPLQKPENHNWRYAQEMVQTLPLQHHDQVARVALDEVRYIQAGPMIQKMRDAQIVTPELWDSIVSMVGQDNRHLIRLRFVAENKGLRT